MGLIARPPMRRHPSSLREGTDQRAGSSRHGRGDGIRRGSDTAPSSPLPASPRVHLRFFWRPAVAGFALLIAGACSSEERSMSAPTAGAGAAATGTKQASPGTTTIASGIVALDAQKLIRSGDLELQVDDVRVAARRADSVALAMGGLVADSRMTRGAQDRQGAELGVRVPSERFGAAMAALSGLGKVNAATTKAEDITKAYADLATRLAVKEQTVLRLRALLDNRTAKLSDVLEVERELAKQVTELEQLKGEQRYYDHRIAVSSITVTLTEGTASHISQLSGPVA